MKQVMGKVQKKVIMRVKMMGKSDKIALSSISVAVG